MRKTLLPALTMMMAAAVVGSVLQWASAWQTAADPAPPAPPASAPSAAAPSTPAPTLVRFNFKGATIDQVIDFFSRATGLPVVKETDVPAGTLDYLSPEPYELPEAMRILNILLQSRGVMLRADGNMLYLQKLTDMQKENIPTFHGEIPAKVTDEQIITVVRPLNIAMAKPLAEKLKAMVAEYGSVAAMEQQNAIVITETAGNVRRLIGIIDDLDRADTEGVVEVFPIRYAKATELLVPLKALMAQKVEKYVINQQGQQVKIEEDQLPGLTVSADDRTNSIIAKGVQNKIEKLRQTIQLLDVPAAAQSRSVRTFALARLAPADAVARLGELYAKLPDDKRPTVLPLDDVGKVTIIGSDVAIAEAAMLLKEIDGGASTAASDAGAEQTVSVIAVAHADPAGVIGAVRNLLSRRQQSLTKLMPGPDGKSVIAAGSSADVESVRALIGVLDAPPKVDRQVRLLRLAGANPQAAAQRARALYDQQVDANDPLAQIQTELDSESRVLTVIGSAAALERFSALIRAVESAAVVDRETRPIRLVHAVPSAMADSLRGMPQWLVSGAAAASSPSEPPAFEPMDAIAVLFVSASPQQHQMIRPLIEALDVAASGDMPPLRILQLRTADAANLANLLTTQYNQRPPDQRQARPVTVTADVQTNTLVVAAHPDLLTDIEAVVNQLNQTDRLDTAGREIRIFPLKVARAQELARTIDDMFPAPPAPVDARGRPRPDLQAPREAVVRADPQTNSLIVDAPVQRMAGFEKLVEQLDRQKIADDTQVRTYPITNANLDSLAGTLTKLAAAGSLGAPGVPGPPGSGAQRVPVTITTEPVSQTLIVSGPAEIFARVEKVLKDLDVKRAGPATTMRFFKLNAAKAESIATMLRDILPARLAEEMPGFAGGAGGTAGAGGGGGSGGALLNVTADRKSNTVIISAPESIMPVAAELIQQLDSTAAVGEPIIRVKPLTFADASAVSSSLSQALPAMTSKATGEPMNVRLIGAPGANALIMVGLEADLAQVEQLIAPLDARPATDAIDARTFRLLHADAANIAPLVQRLLTDQQETDPRVAIERIRRSRGQVATTPTIRVEADQRTNSLVVSGPQQTVALAQTLITQLDEPDETAAKTISTFTPGHADPARLIDGVKRVIDGARPAGQRSALSLVAEPQTGAVVIIGPADESRQARDLLAQWDEQAIVPPQVDLKIISLEHSAAPVVAAALNPLLQDRSRWPAELLAVVRAGVAIGPPTVTADSAGNRLLVSAPAPLLPVAERLVKELDQAPSGAGAMDVRVFGLKQAKAADVAAAVRTAMDARASSRPGEPMPAITAEPSGNALVVAATPQQLAEIELIIKPLDSGMSVDQFQVRTVFLKHARAENVAPLVTQLLAGEQISAPAQRTRGADSRLGEPGYRVRVAADARLNAVVVSAPPAVLNIAEQMVSQLDVDAAAEGGSGSQERQVRVLLVENADAAQLSANLESIFSGADQTDAPPVIRVDAASNSLIVRATPAQFQTIEQVASQIDRATVATTRQMRVIALDPAKGSAEEVARTLQRLLNRGGDSNVEVLSLEELLKRHGQAAPEPSGPKPTSMLPGPLVPSMIVGAVLAVAPQDEPADVTIAVDPATNSLILVGPERGLRRVADLATQIQEQIPAAPSTIRFISLPEGTDAPALAALLTQTLRQMTPGGGKRGDLANRVGVVADLAGNSLIIACNDSDFRTVGELLAAIARPAAGEPVVVKVYPLSTITADRAAASVRGLVALDPAAARGQQARRMRELAVKLIAHGQTIEAVFDPNKIRVAGDPAGNSLIVAGPPEAIAFVDQFIELIDQVPVNVQATLRLYPIRYAKAQELRATLRDLFLARYRSIRERAGPSAIQPEFSSDDRTNTLLVTASPEQLAEVDALLKDLDRKLGEDVFPLRVIELRAALPQQAADVLRQVVLGADAERRASTMIVPSDASGVLLVRAAPEVMTEIDAVLAEVDRDSAGEFPVRTITLERADASAVAATIQRLYDDRAKIASEGRGRRAQQRRVSVIGDRASNTLLVAAADADYEEIGALVKQFDSPQATRSLSFRVFELKHAKAVDIQQTVSQLVSDLTWGQGPLMWVDGRFGAANQPDRGTLAVRADPRLNALIVTGEGDKFAVVEQLIDVLDAPQPDGEQRLVKMYRISHADLTVVADVVREAFTDASRQRRWWEPADPNELKVRVDGRTRTLIISGTGRQQDEAAALIGSIDVELAAADQQTQVIVVQFAQASELARMLRDFLSSRAKATNAPEPTATIVASESANTLVISAGADELATLRDLLTRLDQPNSGGATGERVIEIMALTDGKAEEVARIVTQQFARRPGPGGAAAAGGAGGGGGQGVVVTPDTRTNSLIVNAPRQQFEQVKALITRLDAPNASDLTIIRTYTLTGARAEEAVRILKETLQLDARGQTPGKGISIKLENSDAPPVEVKARVVADKRSNSLVVTATNESFPVIESLIAKLDSVPSASPVEYRIIPLKHAAAADVSATLRSFMRGRPRTDDAQPPPTVEYNRFENQLIIAATNDQFEQITKILEQIDQPTPTTRRTDFVPLKFAEAQKVQEALSVFYGPYAAEADTPGKQNVRIVADPASNSLVISADEQEWQGIGALLAKLDSEEYDASLQLKVMPLTYADARSVARAINDAFQSEQRSPRPEARGPRATDNEQRTANDDQRAAAAPTVLVKTEDWVRASAEPQTNSLVVSASRPNMIKIEQIVKQLDVADYAKMPPPQVIPVTNGTPVQLAESLNRLYVPAAGAQGTGSEQGAKGLRIVADAASNTIIVRAEPEEFAQIKALAEAMQQQASEQGLTIHVLTLKAAPAHRVAAALTDAFKAKAEQSKQPLSIRVDPTGNSLIIASTGPLYAEIAATAGQLDAMAPAGGQGIFIIDLQNISPEAARKVIETIGLDKPQPENSSSRLVSEPVKVSTLSGRNAIVVVAAPSDREIIVGLLKAIDAEPTLAESTMRVVKLKTAKAAALAAIIDQILVPGDQQAKTPLALALQEQVRRLAVRRNGLDQPDVALDLAKPIRVIPDPSLNALVISSTAANVAALEQIVAMFDELPITDAVTVQLFPLQNIAAAQFARIVRELFTQGKQLGAVPGTDIKGVPAGTVGKALLDTIALSVDERTNTVVIAGKQDSVALVEVLAKRIDSDVSTGWVEPRVVPLRYADATDLAQLLQSILVDGTKDLPESAPMQKQVGRLRMALLPRPSEPPAPVPRLSEPPPAPPTPAPEKQPNGAEAAAPRVLESDVFVPMVRLLIRPEPQLNALILVGTPENLAVVAELVKMLDVEAASPSAVVRIYPVQHASASRLATTITRLFDQQVASKAIRPEDRVIVQPDERTNALVVTTSTRSFAVLEHVLKTLDAPIAPDLKEIQRIDLKNASAARLASMIQQLMDARLERLRKVQPETADLERATIVPDPRTNSLIVAAGAESLDVIRKLAADLDVSTLTDQSLVQVITLEKGNVLRLSEAVTKIMDRRWADMPEDLRRSQRPLVLTDTRSNSLLVAANPEDLAAIRDLVAKLEATPLNSAIGLHVVAVEGSRAEVLAPRLEKLMRERQQSLGESGTTRDRVTIEPDPASNSLIVAASEENLQVVRGLIDALAKADGMAAGGEFEIIPLARSRATDVLDLLNSMYVTDENRRRGTNTIRVSADERVNAVLVNAPAADVRSIRDLVAQLDGAKPATTIEIKYVPLASANALETVSLIQNVLSGRGLDGRRSSRQATVVKYLREIVEKEGGAPGVAPGAGASEMEVSAAIRESITLTPDIRTNTIIVSAPRDSIRMIEQMIRDLDASSTGAQNIRIFKLVNADALAMAQILTELFNLRQQGNLFVLKPREQGQGLVPGAGSPGNGAGAAGAEAGAAPVMGGGGGGGGGDLSTTELTAVPDERQQLSITVDSRTNSLLVSATPTYLDLVEKVVTELDSLEANERMVQIYRLNNAVAADVARVVGGFVDTEQQKLLATLSAEQVGSSARLLEREITIVGDEKSNSVVVSASPRFIQRVESMIKELDVDPPQVLIQVLLAEVTLDSTSDWAVNLFASGEIGSVTVSGGYQLASRLFTGLGAPNLAITSSDFDLLLKALEAQGRLQVLSNPSVMAANNQPARIQVGETIRLPSSVSFVQGSQQSAVVPQDIGIILSVTASINPDGFVRMSVSPEISELSNRTTQISEDFESPIITKRTADTTVTVKDGQTIVLGGLISDRYEKRDEKVPLLGDIPLIGALFRSEHENSAKTELLIVLTPHVIVSPAQIGRVQELTDSAINRMPVAAPTKEGMRQSIVLPAPPPAKDKSASEQPAPGEGKFELPPPNPPTGPSPQP